MTIPASSSTDADRRARLRPPLAWFVGIFLAPILLGGNMPGSVIPTDIAIAFGEAILLVSLCWMLLTRPAHLQPSARRFLLLWGVLTLYALTSLWWSMDRDASIAALLPLLTALATAFAVLAFANTRSLRRLTIQFLAAGVIVVCLYAIYQGIYGFSHLAEYLSSLGASSFEIDLVRSFNRAFGTLIGANPMGGLAALCAPLCIWLVVKSSSKGGKTVWVIGFLITLAALYATGSRGAMLVLVGEILLLLLASSAGIRTTLLFAVTGAVILVGCLFLAELLVIWKGVHGAPTLLDRLVSLSSLQDYSQTARLQYFNTAIHAGTGLAPLGAGFGAYESVCRAFQQEPFFARDPHNLLLTFFAELGPAGVVLLLAATLYPLAMAFLRWRNAADNLRRWTIVMQSVVYFGMLAHMQIDMDLRSPIWVLLLLLAGGLLASDETPEEGDESAIAAVAPPPQPVHAEASSTWRPPFFHAVIAVLIPLIVTVPAFAQGWRHALADSARSLLDTIKPDMPAAQRLETLYASIGLAGDAARWWPLDAQANLNLLRACDLLRPQGLDPRCPKDGAAYLSDIRRALPLHPGPVFYELERALDLSQLGAAEVRRICMETRRLHPLSLQYFNRCRWAVATLEGPAAAARDNSAALALIKRHVEADSPERFPVYEGLFLIADFSAATCDLTVARQTLHYLISLTAKRYAPSYFLDAAPAPFTLDQIESAARQRLNDLAERDCPPSDAGPSHSPPSLPERPTAPADETAGPQPGN